jgi:hypothetical protein
MPFSGAMTGAAAGAQAVCQGHEGFRLQVKDGQPYISSDRDGLGTRNRAMKLQIQQVFSEVRCQIGTQKAGRGARAVPAHQIHITCVSTLRMPCPSPPRRVPLMNVFVHMQLLHQETVPSLEQDPVHGHEAGS